MTGDPTVDGLATVVGICTFLAGIAICEIAHILIGDAKRQKARRRPLEDVEPWISEGDPPRVTPDRRHRPRSDWRERCNT